MTSDRLTLTFGVATGKRLFVIDARVISVVVVCFGHAILSCQAQFPVIPAKTVAETRLPIFAGGEEASPPLANFRFYLKYESGDRATLEVGEHRIELPPGQATLEMCYEHLPEKEGLVLASLEGIPVLKKAIPAVVVGSDGEADFESENPELEFGADFTAWTRFKSGGKGKGTLFSKCLPGKQKWTPGAKALFIRGGRLVYDIGWLGMMSGGRKVTDGEWCEALLIVEQGRARLFIDGKRIAEKGEFTAPDKDAFVFKIGKSAPNFAFDLEDTEIAGVRYWSRALEGKEIEALMGGKGDEVNTPDLNWKPGSDRSPTAQPLHEPMETFAGLGQAGLPVTLRLHDNDSFRIEEAWAQALEPVNHVGLINGWSEESFHEGKEIYRVLCTTCHGNREQEGSIPIAMKFHSGEFKNGSDPYRMYQTLTKGYGMMVPQPQCTPEQKYALIHYIRDEFLAMDNPTQLFQITDDYLEALPQELTTAEKVEPAPDPSKDRPYEQMDFGPALMWTYQVGGDDLPNIAQKGINIRVDRGTGGVSKGRNWMIYEEDTMRVAAAYSGEFVDWKGIAFDQSHGTHTSIAGEPLFVSRDEPAWKNPNSGDWEDDRVVGRDGRRYGPVSDDWIRYLGLFYHGIETPVLHYRIGSTEIYEQPGLIEYGESPVFTRNLNVGRSQHDLVTRLSDEDRQVTVLLSAPDGISVRDGELTIPASATPANILIGLTAAPLDLVKGILGEPKDLAGLTRGGAARFGKEAITVRGELGDASGPFAVDTIPVPNREGNPWQSWMRLGGFDFFAENPDRAAVCTWLGDVWLVDGVAGDLREVKWRRICSGLFQPLGLKIVDGVIHVTCRDQIARLHDLNGDEEIDYVECFNHHAQVTEHFHEFAMGLQTDDNGNFYYAKSARHAKTAVVPHHGTLLRVSPDGKKTDIVAAGFRAANGVCLNPDGTWIVTDQEGHWNPKNRINYVREGGFYGNMFGFHDITDSSDDAMEQPLFWITNAFDRSPAELVWVPQDAGWGSLNGVLLNLSYGYGQIFTVPHEVPETGSAQGGMCALPIGRLPTGVHRGRFHPENGQLYAVGMFAWAGSQKEDGGFFRIRRTGQPAHLPVKTEATRGRYTITFSDELPERGVFRVTTWDLKRTRNYGSKHYNEKELKVTGYEIQGNRVILRVPDLKPTRGMEIRCLFSGDIERVIHGSIHQLR